MMEGLDFKIVISDFEENLDQNKDPADYVLATAQEKTRRVAEMMRDRDSQSQWLVIGADTIVSLGNEILEKPRDSAHALEMMKRLSGTRHQVLTALCIHYKRQDGTIGIKKHVESTFVEFGSLSQELMQAYVDSGEPMYVH